MSSSRRNTTASKPANPIIGARVTKPERAAGRASVVKAGTTKTVRTPEENQERAYIAASRRTDRSDEARIESARRASEIHKRRTGRALRVTEQDVLNDEMYEEEELDLPTRLNAHMSTSNMLFRMRLQDYIATHTAMRDGARGPQSQYYPNFNNPLWTGPVNPFMGHQVPPPPTPNQVLQPAFNTPLMPTPSPSLPPTPNPTPQTSSNPSFPPASNQSFQQMSNQNQPFLPASNQYLPPTFDNQYLLPTFYESPLKPHGSSQGQSFNSSTFNTSDDIRPSTFGTPEFVDPSALRTSGDTNTWEFDNLVNFDFWASDPPAFDASNLASSGFETSQDPGPPHGSWPLE